MASRTFSSRADERGLAYADAVVRERFGMSYGQYCGSILIEAIMQGVELPTSPCGNANRRKRQAIESMKSISKRDHDASIGKLSDNEIRAMIASRYE